MKLYIAEATCSQAVQVIANELGLDLELVHYNVYDKSLSNGGDFSHVNKQGYVPVLELDTPDQDRLTETVVILSYLADRFDKDARLAPARGTPERWKLEQLLVFTATELAQKHIPLMRKLLTEEGTAFNRAKLVNGYTALDTLLADGRPYLTGDGFTILDAYVWATMWHKRSGAEISHLKNLMAYQARIDARPSVQKALREEAETVAAHVARAA
ncbi:glutathione S-transferase N-terminal domain-containing protein [Dyella sedimenti]|uniref:glutathione S-transferase N-terminal domain-containing protein n=1 Tax=Dyella sedimenti TaxID=2919947 RepID=UPI001FA99A4C|nr:glutathione S-transferase N-terminal domain-containing protein [Dyella sedimenti]